MDTQVESVDLERILKELNLSQYYSGKLQRDDIFAVISNGGDHLQNVHLAQYISDIVHFNENCRYLDQHSIDKSGTIRGKQKSVDDEIKTCLDLHPVDISTVLFLCSNNNVRQDLVVRHWFCKLAYPLVIKPEQLEPPTLYLWPTLGLINKHLSTNLHQYVEDNTSNIGFKIVSFLRFNNYDVSKSHIINLLINKTEKVHSVFYHRNCAARVGKMSDVCHGMIEVFPHLDNDKEPILFLNLRGQCNRCQNQKLFLSKVSHVVFLVCSKAETHLIQDFIKKDIGKSCEKVVIIFIDLDITEESDALLSQLDSFSEKLCVSNHLVGYKGMSHSDLREELNTSIKSVKGRHNFDDIKTKANDHHFSIDLNTIEDALKRSEKLSNLVFQMFKEHALECVFPIKGHLCSEWCKTDLEKYKLRLRGNTENVGKYRKRLEIKQNELRSQQLKLITDEKCKILHLFINNMSLSNDIENVEVFLRNLKLSIEMATRPTMLKAHEEYRNLFEKLRMMPAKTDDIHKEFRRLDGKLENQSLSFLDFSREMGHMYEILIDKNINQEYQKKLLDIAVTILRYGYEIEIMDGRSNWVPIIWVKSILLEMRRRLGNVRIKVITVLGVQSSGKSTLLNIMFGSQFAVGSGRCTRGMYMHLVKVSDKASREYMVDYLLIIDTEGLYSSITKVDETNERDKTERELATLAIGMSHVTVVNIMGEDMSYLHEILPITVHAFLRMDLVGLRPKCKFLHHTVEKSSNDKLLQNTFGLERILDEHTATACTLENIPKKRFRDIIHFDSIEDVYFFSPLFESVDDLKIVSSLYSKDASYLKEKLIIDTESVGTLEELANHVALLWNAVKKDDFVFEFRDTVETQARVALDKRICHLQWKSKSEFLCVLAEFRTEIKSCDTLEKVNEVQQRYNQSINCTTNEQIKANADDLLVADFAQDRLRTHAMQRLLESSKITLEDYTQECRLYCDSQIDQDVTLRMKELDILRCSEFAFIQIDEFLDKHVSFEPSNTLRDTSSWLFDKWLGELSHLSSYSTLFNLEEDAVEAIYKIFSTRRAQIDKSIQFKGFNDRKIDTFLNEIPEILSSTNVRLVTQTKHKMASEVAEDTMLYAKHVLLELQRRNIFYEPNIFKDISLQVRSHRHISSGSLQTKPNFEIELVLYICGEFIQRFRRISEEGIMLTNGLMKTAQSYFLSRCRQKSNNCTNTTQAVKDFSNVLIEEIGLSIIAFLPQELANSIKDCTDFLQSKQLFVIHSYIKMLDNENVLHAYLSSFEAGAVYIISNVYENMFRTTDAVQKIVRRTLESNITRACTNLVNEIENLKPDSYPINTMELCIQVIIKALKPISSINLKQFQNDYTDDLDPQIVLRLLLTNLRDNKYIAKIEQTVQELYFGAYYSKLKNETVEIVIQNVTGCREMCPFCGETCCIGQEKHAGDHRALMHRPSGFQGKCTLSTPKLDSSTCWDELEKLSTDRQRSHIVQGWTIPKDVSTEENSFWKYVFVTNIKYITLKWGKEEPEETPEPWKVLSKATVLGKLERELEKMFML